MAGDSFTEVTHQSWFGRIGESIKGIVLGLVLFGVSFPLLWWNEGRAVERYRALKEGAAVVVSVPADTVDPQNDAKLVHLSGKAVTDGTVTDDTFGVSAEALKLRRQVQMYQWEEHKSSRRKKKLGGGTRTVTTYNYNKTWADHVINSQDFREPAGHENPGSMPYRSGEWQADEVTVGAFRLAPSLVDRIDAYQSLSVEGSVLPQSLRGKVKSSGSGFYIGGDPGVPQVGDVRISFQITPPTDVSIVAAQTKGTLATYATKSGSSLEMLQLGTHTSDAMFERAHEQNRMLTWLLRLAGLIAMAVGLGLIFRPISVVADVIPFLGSLVGMGIGLAAFLVALCLSLVTIAIAWVAHRPLLGIGLLVGAAIVLGLILGRAKASRPPARA
jgi:hypothetical protein